MAQWRHARAATMGPTDLLPACDSRQLTGTASPRFPGTPLALASYMDAAPRLASVPDDSDLATSSLEGGLDDLEKLLGQAIAALRGHERSLLDAVVAPRDPRPAPGRDA